LELYPTEKKGEEGILTFEGKAIKKSSQSLSLLRLRLFLVKMSSFHRKNIANEKTIEGVSEMVIFPRCLDSF
jgi:glycerol-3-phosphate responsive antiterminator